MTVEEIKRHTCKTFINANTQFWREKSALQFALHPAPRDKTVMIALHIEIIVLAVTDVSWMNRAILS